MKNSVLICLLSICFAIKTLAQNQDAIWLLSINSINIDDKCGIDFNVLPADTFIDYRKLGFIITNASICDTSGNILFYTNGIYVANRDHDTLWNSGNFNPGYASDYYWYPGLGFSQGAIILTRPDYPEKYLIFHVSGEEFEAYGENQLQPLHLGMSEVDMTLDGGLGGIPVNKKNIPIVEDTVTQGRITAVKHANGRDWWVVQHKFYSDVFYTVLVQPDTVVVSSQAVGPVQTSNDIVGMAKFSPDGSRYCYMNYDLTFDLFDFDRCSGELSNHQRLEVPDSLSIVPYTLGSEFSSSGQFLYINTFEHLYQYNLWSSDIQQSVIEIATWDTTYLPTATWFFLPQRAPDGKIYISTYNSTEYLHVIDNPDSLGLACSFSQHSFALGEHNTTTPNFPNYQLGKLEGSPCDTLFSGMEHASNENKGLSLAPNPATDRVEINYNLEEKALLTITDMYGKAVLLQMLYPYFTSRIIYTNHLPEGMYQVTLMQGDEIIATEKLVLQR
ncbi:MAG: T9SS type A sorting domain-containing protein [Chitinophagaceae bacterium]|nr:T9SS type A sorting domain-containing protein [Chitinophagaceae bacterium]